jgi:hypothetical protein
MASWPTGIDTIRRLIAAHSLQKVAASREGARTTLDAAAKHMDSAQLLDPTRPPRTPCSTTPRARAWPPSYKRKALRSTSRGGHYAIQEAISTQFTKPPLRDAFRPFGRLRRTRNQIEYDISPITADDIELEEPAVRTLHSMACQLVEVLPVFVD